MAKTPRPAVVDGTMPAAQNTPLDGPAQLSESVTPEVSKIVTPPFVDGDAEMPAVDEARLAGAAPSVPVVSPDAAETFDPAIHETDASGQPIPRADGKGFKRRRGRKGGENAAPKINGATASKVQGARPIASPLATAPMDKSEMEAKARAAAVNAVGLTQACSMMIFGPDDGALKKFKDEDAGVEVDEPTQWFAAWNGYFLAKGVTDIPPGLALAIVGVSHVASRMRAEKVQKRVGGLVNRIKGFFIRRKAAQVENGEG